MEKIDQMDNDISDFLIKGYYTDFYKSDLSLEFKDKVFADCNSEINQNIDEETQLRLDLIHQDLYENYILKLFPYAELKDNGMWDGVDEGSAIWHNDQEDGDTFNSNILIYIDDNTPYNNSIEITDGKEEYKIIPKPNQLVWINQRKVFKHRAIHNDGVRRLLSFEFFIEELVD